MHRRLDVHNEPSLKIGVLIMLDRDGFRPNVGIVLLNQKNQVFWGKRIRTHSWQFPQGGIDRGETPEQAMYRELHEEVGLQPEHVAIIARTRDWLRYEVPDRYIRRDARGHYKGQKQIWFLLQLTGFDWNLNLRATEHPEFDAWRWNDYWVPLDAVVDFKRGVYEMALTENLEPCDFNSPDRWWRGIADLLIINGDEARCVDYKTGKSAKYADTDQLELMAMAVFKHFPQVKKVKAGLLFVISKNFIKSAYHADNQDKMWAKWIGEYNRMKAAYRNDVWNPRPSGLCRAHCLVLTCPHNGKN